MKKTITAVVCIFAVIFSFAACSKKTENTEYTDEDGQSYIAVRDNDSNIIVNSSGKLCVYTLNENGKKQKSDSGEYITEYIDFNGQVVSDSVIETDEMRFTLPKNFVSDIKLPGYFSLEEYQAEIFIDYYTDNIDTAIKAVEINSETLLENYGSEFFSYEKYTVKVGSADCTAIKQSCSSGEYYMTLYNYFIPYDSGYYFVNCSVSTEHAKKVDFDSFVESIELK